jgi:bifunctional NMN adenylyltransferase/nudix hydrolase
LPGAVRQALLEWELAGIHCHVVQLDNNPSDEQWSKNFDELLKKTVGDRHCVIYGARDNSLHCYSGRHKTFALNLNLPVAATEIREKMCLPPNHPLDLQKFAEGIIYAANIIFPTSYSVVDLAILRKKEKQKEIELLLCGKPTDAPDRWRFCGGFVDPTDLTLEAAARREKAEELGINLEVDGYQFIGDTLIDDWRYRGTEHAVRSMFHVCWHQWGAPLPQDDINRARWFNMKDLDEVIIKGHKPLAELLKQYVNVKNLNH